MKSKHVDWTLGLKHDHQVWPWKWPWSWIFRVKYGTCCISAKNGPLPQNERQAYRLNSRPQIWPMELTLAMTLTFLSWPSAWIFRVKYGLCYISAKIFWLPQNKKQTYRLNTKPQMWSLGLTLAMTFILNFQCQIWTLLYLSQNWSNCHETKSKHIVWTLGLKYYQWDWPWIWPWSGIFKVK